MTHDVFISYSQKDKAAAESVCLVLEQNGITCWIAPRDIAPGVTWANAIVRAIEACKVMALMCSSNANDSRQMSRECQLADSHKIPIVPVRVENVALAGDIEYFLNNTQWFDAFPGTIDDHAARLVNAFRDLLTAQSEASRISAPPPVQPVHHAAPGPVMADSPAPAAKSRRLLWIIGGAVALVLVVLLVKFFGAGDADSVGSPGTAQIQEQPKQDQLSQEAAKPEDPKQEDPKAEDPKQGEPKPEEPKPEEPKQ